MQAWLYSLGSVFLLSVISLVGVFVIFFREEKVRKIALFIVSFAVGALFGDVFIHILPESFERMGMSLKIPFLILAGLLAFFILEKFLRWRHCHVSLADNHHHPVIWMNVFGDGLHNLIDGMLIGASFLVSFPLGLATTLAIVFHEIPQEISDIGMFLRFGLSKRKALFFNFLSSLSAFIGVFISLVVGSYVENFALLMLPLTAGGFLYIAGSDLIPELHHETKISSSATQFASIIFGILVMALLTLV